ncbi:MAG: type II secretion system F family protein [Dehalococcoidia bacterium]|jgi:type IV pilus assembly protein PilC
MIYRYQAYNKDKNIIQGKLESVSVEAAESMLYRAGFERIIKLEKAGQSFDWRKIFLGQPRVKPQALLDFTNELAMMIESGLSLQASLSHLEKQTSTFTLQNVIGELAIDLEAGIPLHQALEKHPRVFSQTYCSMIEANESSGTLDSGLRQIAKEIKEQIDTRSKIQQSLLQPIIIIVAAIGVLAILMVFVMPKLTSVFGQLGAELPLAAKILVNTSDFVNAYKFELLAAILIIVLGIALMYRSRWGKNSLDKQILKLALIGELVLWQNTARISRSLSNLLNSGILLPNALNIVLRSVGNTRIYEALNDVRTRLLQGQSFSSSLSDDNVFPELLMEMVAVGETAGALEASLVTVAEYFETKTQQRITRLTSLLEPALIVIIALGVGFIAVAVISTVYGVLDTIK